MQGVIPAARNDKVIDRRREGETGGKRGRGGHAPGIGGLDRIGPRRGELLGALFVRHELGEFLGRSGGAGEKTLFTWFRWKFRLGAKCFPENRSQSIDSHLTTLVESRVKSYFAFPARDPLGLRRKNVALRVGNRNLPSGCRERLTPHSASTPRCLSLLSVDHAKLQIL